MSQSAEVHLRRCPICSRPQNAKFHPFCSRHCADIDLAKWLGGGYAIPVVEEDDRPEDGGDEDGETGSA